MLFIGKLTNFRLGHGCNSELLVITGVYHVYTNMRLMSDCIRLHTIYPYDFPMITSGQCYQDQHVVSPMDRWVTGYLTYGAPGRISR